MSDFGFEVRTPHQGRFSSLVNGTPTIVGDAIAEAVGHTRDQAMQVQPAQLVGDASSKLKGKCIA
jgi:hypothetical protein